MSGTKEIVEALFVLLVIVSIIQLGIYWITYRRLAFYKPKQIASGQKPVSVIICARNEAERLKLYLPSVLGQDYSSFEVIVVNDCSWDDTDLVLKEFARNHTNLKIVTINEQEKYRHGKKFALTLGIKAAANELLLLTDADCMPSGKQWISLMQRNYTGDTEIVLGYGAYNRRPGLLNKLIRFDTLLVAMQFLSSALSGSAYMGVGRNLSYKKSVFFRNKGFARHNHLLSGDDDLFINENATHSNTTIETDPEAFTYSEPKTSLGAWFTQKNRHLSTYKFYKPSHKFSLALRNGSQIFFFLLLVILLILQFDWRILVSLYAFLLLARMPVIYIIATKMKEKDLVWSFPLLEIIHTFLQPIFFFSNLITKQNTWK
jgi:cellulose synthase/poly-beta-1,6-N-acetylglucosamine synthase-like glycosyltransferase